MHSGLCYPNGSYFASDYLRNIALKCVSGTANTFGGEVLLPNGNTCNNTSEPIQCSRDDDGGFVLKKVNSRSYSSDQLGYKCCLPHKCDDSTGVIIFNLLHGKYMYT